MDVQSCWYKVWGHLDLDISPGRNHLSPKEQERISFEKISFVEIFLCFKGFEMVVRKNEIHGEAMGLKLEGYAGSRIFAHGTHPPGHKNLSEDASIRGLKVMAYFLDYSNTPQ